jgi:adenosylcobinamide kinase/adenosylcobinamide-phosphate guanylyltransferase
MNIFISGGAKNGKSTFAQNLAVELAGKSGLPLYYIATMIARDEEDDARIKRHIEDRRGLGFRTIEEGMHVESILNEVSCDGVFLLDSVTAFVANRLFSEDEQGNFVYKPEEGPKLAEELVSLAERVKNIIFVSDYIYSDAGCFDEMTEYYRKTLAACDRKLAAVCDRVYEVISGIPKRRK